MASRELPLTIKHRHLSFEKRAPTYPRSLLSATSYRTQRMAVIRALGHASRLINRALGGERNETLCARVAARFSPDCLFCSLIGMLLREPSHCADELRNFLSRRD